ncbi:MAG: hypothetical protein HY424_03125 [Candidatus Levybacteria bacterium]|nr:hypothetical protein [Candidatus Levybacteria bacterium]
MISIIHGDDNASSRNYFLEMRKKQKNNISFNGEKVTITDLVQNTQGSGFFGDINVIFIEDLLTKNKKNDGRTKELIGFMVKTSKKFSFVLWESKEILKRDLSLFKDAIIKRFKLPRNIFLFLDSLKPHNSKNLIKMFHNTLDSGIKEELILFMTQRQVRILMALSDRGEKSIDELTRFAPWQMEKLERQARLFDIQTLKSIYKKLFEIETGYKTGVLNLSLVQAIDFLLLEI